MRIALGHVRGLYHRRWDERPVAQYHRGGALSDPDETAPGKGKDPAGRESMANRVEFKGTTPSEGAAGSAGTDQRSLDTSISAARVARRWEYFPVRESYPLHVSSVTQLPFS